MDRSHAIPYSKKVCSTVVEHKTVDYTTTLTGHVRSTRAYHTHCLTFKQQQTVTMTQTMVRFPNTFCARNHPDRLLSL